MYNIPGDLLDAFKAAPEVVAKVLEGCTQEQAVAAKGGDENWSVVEGGCHLRDAEERGLQRTRQMRDQDDPSLKDHDQDAWACERNNPPDHFHECLTAFLRF